MFYICFIYRVVTHEEKYLRDDCMEFNHYIIEIHVSFELKTVLLLSHLYPTKERYSNQKTKLDWSFKALKRW